MLPDVSTIGPPPAEDTAVRLTAYFGWFSDGLYLIWEFAVTLCVEQCKGLA